MATKERGEQTITGPAGPASIANSATSGNSGASLLGRSSGSSGSSWASIGGISVSSMPTRSRPGALSAFGTSTPRRSGSGSACSVGRSEFVGSGGASVGMLLSRPLCGVAGRTSLTASWLSAICTIGSRDEQTCSAAFSPSVLTTAGRRYWSMKRRTS